MIKVIDKSLNIIEILARNPQREFTLTEIADELKMDRGTCSNIIRTLQQRGYIQQSAPRCGYKFGYMFYKLTDNPVNNENLTIIANDNIITLGEKLNESAVLSIIKNDKRIVLVCTIPNREQTIRTNIEKSVYKTNTGRVIIANYSPEHLQRFVSRVGFPTKDEWPEIYNSPQPEKEFFNRLAEIKTAGYELFTGNNDIVALAAPLFRKGHVVGSVGVYLPSSRMNKTILSSVLECARSINEKINAAFKPDPYGSKN